MELDRRGAELLFQVLTEHEETTSVAIAINESFTGWTKTFTCPRLCAAIVDRLTFAGNIIETGTCSYRLAHPQRHRIVSGHRTEAANEPDSTASRPAVHAAAALGWFTDSLAFATYHPEPGE
jgi:IstB-like ATP binding protein